MKVFKWIVFIWSAMAAIYMFMHQEEYGYLTLYALIYYGMVMWVLVDDLFRNGKDRETKD